MTNNVISDNTIIEACASILVGTAAGSNSIGSNTFFNARNTVLTADGCIKMSGVGGQAYFNPLAT